MSCGIDDPRCSFAAELLSLPLSLRPSSPLFFLHCLSGYIVCELSLLILTKRHPTIMAPSAVDYRGIMTNGIADHQSVNGTSKVDTMNPHELVKFDPSLKPKYYQMKGTDSNSKILFLDVNIIDSTGRDPYQGDVYIEGMNNTRRDCSQC